jgi:pyrroline-5-carboxylate reductase
MEQVLEPLKQLFKDKKPLVITMAAGIKTEKIAEYCGCDLPVIRIMPNTPVSVGKGMVLYCTNDLVNQNDIEKFLFDMRFAGEFDCLPESLIDAGCSVSGCGPAFMYMFIDALAEGGVACGLSREKAIKYAECTMRGAAELALASGKEPEQLKREVCSPGGSTIEGVKKFEEGCLKECAINAVKASFKRNKELGN